MCKTSTCTQRHSDDENIQNILCDGYYMERSTQKVLLLAEIKLQSEHLPVTGNNNSSEDPNKWNHIIQEGLIQYDFYSSNSREL